MRRPPVTLIAAIAAAVVLPACGAGAIARADDGLRIVVTTTILGELVNDLVGTSGTVDVLMRPGQEPHEFAASARQVEAIHRADLVVTNGLGLEAGLRDVLDMAESDGIAVLDVGDRVDPLPVPGAPGAAGKEFADDPHVWFDASRMAQAARVVAAALARVDGSGTATDWPARGAAAADRLEALDRQVADIFTGLPARCRRLVTNHDAFRYLTARYGLEVVGTVTPGTSPEADTSARDFANLVDVLADTELPAVFVEAGQSRRLADALAAEVDRDVDVVPLFTGSLGPPGSGAETYAALMTTDARRIVAALSDC